jgi:hypothetical protein
MAHDLDGRVNVAAWPKARAARGEIEAARRISRWIDALIVIEESSR